MTDIPPPPPAYGAPVPPAGANPPKNWMGLTSLILGIVGIVGCCCYAGLPLGGAAIVLGYLGKQAAAKGEANNGNFANIGFILGIVGVALFFAGIVISLIQGSFDLASSVR